MKRTRRMAVPALLVAGGVRFVVTDYVLPSRHYRLVKDYAGAGWPVKLYEVIGSGSAVYVAGRARVRLSLSGLSSRISSPSRRA